MHNPFKFGDPVWGEFYLPRKELAFTIRQFLENRIHVVLMGPRRFGKTSFVLNLLEQLEQQGYTCLFADIFNITSHRDFMQQLLKAIEEKRSFKNRLRAWWEKIKKLYPRVSAEFDSTTGHSSYGFTLTQLSEEDTKSVIQDLLRGLSDLGSKVIIALDEFQKSLK